MAFDPDKYLAEKSKGFDPDAYLAQKTGGPKPASLASPNDSSGNNISQLESLLRGGAQGATMGFADELAGGGEALLDKVSGQDNGKSLMDLYKQHRDESRANFDAAEKANPLTSLAGGLAGGIIPGVLSGGVGEVAAAGGAYNKIKTAAKLGAAAGALGGLGGSTADLTQGNIGGALTDAGKGLVEGGITGGVLGTAVEGAKGLGKGVANVVKQTRLGKDLGEAFNMGQEGTNLLSDKSIRNIEGSERANAAKSVSSQLLGLKSELGKSYDKVAQDFSNGNINVDEATQKIQGIIGGLSDKVPEQAADKQKLTTLLNNFTQGKAQATEFTPSSTEQIPATPSARDILKQKLDRLNAKNQFEGGSSALSNVSEGTGAVGGSDYNIQDIPGEGGKNYLGIMNKDNGLTGMPVEDTPGTPASTKLNPSVAGEEYTAGTYPIKSLPYEETKDLKSGFKNLSNFGRGMSSQEGENAASQATGVIADALDKQVPGSEAADEAYHSFMEDVLNRLGIKNSVKRGDDNAIEKTLGKIIFNAEQSTKIGYDTKNAVTQAMDSLKSINPEVGQQVQDTIDKASRRIRIARMANNESFPTAGNVLDTAKGLVGIKGANAAGYVTGKASKYLVDMPSQSLANVGNSLSASDNELAKKLGGVLVQASQKDQIGRNALIFSLMQNPDYRKLLSSQLNLGE